MYIDNKVVPIHYTLLLLLYCIITRVFARNILLLYCIIIETVIDTLFDVVTLIAISQKYIDNIIAVDV